MVNKRFNRKFRRILSISSLGALCCSQTINAMLNDSLRSTSLYFKECLLDTVTCDPFHDQNTVSISAGGNRRSGTWWQIHKKMDYHALDTKWVYLTYKDDNTPKTNIILWKFDYDKAIVLPGSESVYNAINKYCDKRYDLGMKNLKPTKEMEDIAWDRGTEAFIKSLENQINQEKNKKETQRKDKEENEERKNVKQVKEDKSTDNKLLIYGIPTGILTFATIVGTAVSTSKSSQNTPQVVYIKS